MNRSQDGAAKVAGPDVGGGGLPVGTVVSFLAVVGRIEALVDAETEALTRNLPINMAEISRRKHYGLLELSRGFRAIGTHGLQSEVRDRVGLLATKLEANRRALDVQLRAVREITDIIAEAITEAESDGTYSLRTVAQ